MQGACSGFEKGLQNMLSELTRKPILKSKKSKSKSRHAVAKVRRSRLEGSHSGHQAISTEERLETSMNSDKHEHPKPDDGISGSGAAHRVEPSDQEVHVDPNNRAQGEITKDAPVQPDERARQPLLEEFGQPNTCLPAALVTGAHESNTIPTVETGAQHFATTTDKVHNKTPPQNAQAGKITDDNYEDSDEDEVTYRIDSDPFNIRRKSTSKINFFEFVKGEPKKEPKMPDIKQCEEPVFLDIGLAKPARDAFHGMIQSLKEKEEMKLVDPPSMVDTNERDNLTRKLLHIEVPKPRGKKRKTVTFEEHPQSDKQGISSAAVSPSKYRTRAAACVEMASITETNVGAPEVEPATKSPRRLHSPIKQTTGQCSPSVVPSQIVTRSKLTLQTSAATESPAIGDQKTKPNAGTTPQTEDHTSPQAQDPMFRRLSFSVFEDEKRKQKLAAAPDAPSFNLGFDTQEGPDDQAGCSKDVDASDASKTPVAHEYQKRVIDGGILYR